VSHTVLSALATRGRIALEALFPSNAAVDTSKQAGDWFDPNGDGTSATLVDWRLIKPRASLSGHRLRYDEWMALAQEWNTHHPETAISLIPEAHVGDLSGSLHPDLRARARDFLENLNDDDFFVLFGKFVQHKTSEGKTSVELKTSLPQVHEIFPSSSSADKKIKDAFSGSDLTADEGMRAWGQEVIMEFFYRRSQGRLPEPWKSRFPQACGASHGYDELSMIYPRPSDFFRAFASGEVHHWLGLFFSQANRCESPDYIERRIANIDRYASEHLGEVLSQCSLSDYKEMSRQPWWDDFSIRVPEEHRTYITKLEQLNEKERQFNDQWRSLDCCLPGWLNVALTKSAEQGDISFEWLVNVGKVWQKLPPEVCQAWNLYAESEDIESANPIHWITTRMQAVADLSEQLSSLPIQQRTQRLLTFVQSFHTPTTSTATKK
jgi:hypothetical protein